MVNSVPTINTVVSFQSHCVGFIFPSLKTSTYGQEDTNNENNNNEDRVVQDKDQKTRVSMKKDTYILQCKRTI